MGFVESIKHVLSNYVGFHGRAGRAEFWWWVLFAILVSIVAGILDALIFGAGAEPGSVQPLGALVTLALLLPNIAVSVRRLHDTGKSGWWILISLVPIIGFFVLLYFYIKKGDVMPNKHGAPPPGLVASTVTA